VSSSSPRRQNIDKFRYLFETGEFSECVRISNIALKATKRDTILHAHLQNSLAVTSFGQNDLRQARSHWEVALRIMKDRTGGKSEYYIGLLSNWGNMLAAEQQNQEAINIYLEAERAREELDLPKTMALAYINLGIGRMELLENNMEVAQKRFKAARNVVEKHHGARGQCMQEYVQYSTPGLRKSGLQVLINQCILRAWKPRICQIQLHRSRYIL
jgi:tetratricopeptide (TPR) repeat protein